jgi:hypothetical protein
MPQEKLLPSTSGCTDGQNVLSITHILRGEEEAEMDISEAG